MSKWDHRFLELAELVSTWSKDPSTKVGAVIVSPDNRIVSLGFNGFPVRVNDDDRLARREVKYKMVLHAEENAILFAGRRLGNCSIYTYPLSPCPHCASVIIQSGIDEVIFPIGEVPDRWKDDMKLALKMFEEACVSWRAI
tara:strand:- start:2139 stop:2561 length:423 start_codon:yes stop_codon:yes gene_type:complete